ncbi:putative MFS transporter [Aspergillus stella-maris]|uniref:putative MFS transporter n=1 Tax=Aspergillus stella-maris TaxID=1810926 RepID=UPI003CCD0C8E
MDAKESKIIPTATSATAPNMSLSNPSSDPEPVLSDATLLRHIDWRILPVMLLAYFLQFLDKVCLNYANVMNLQSDLNMSGNDFSWLATAFFIAYAVAEGPQGFLLQKYPVTRVLGVNIVLWGVIICASAGAQKYTDILALRIILGITESVIAPALTIYTSMWYTRRESTPRFGLWYCGLGAGQIIGGLISFGAQHAPPNAPLKGWRVMFLVIGLVNVLAGFLVLFLLPATPSAARFLNDSEKERIEERLRSDNAGVGRKTFHAPSIWTVLFDPQSCLLMLLTVLTVIPSGVIVTYSSILIRGFGYTAKESALLNMPSGVVSILSTLACTFAIQKGYARWLMIDILLVPTLVGACLMSFLPDDMQGGLLVGIYMVNTTVAPTILIYSWTGTNFKRYTGKVTACAMIQVGFGIANIIGPQTFQARDAPGYIPAKITIVVTNAVAIGICTGLRVLYGIRNARADREGISAESWVERKMEKADHGGFDEVGEGRFRYVY